MHAGPSATRTGRDASSEDLVVMYLLDSNVLIEHMAGRFDLEGVLRNVGLENCFVPTVVIYELLHGSLRSRLPNELERTKIVVSGFRWIGFEADAAESAAKIRFELERIGLKIGPHDVMIAAIALSQKFTLVTHNVRELSRVQGLKIEDWQAAAGP